MPIPVTCRCGRRINASRKYAGQKVKCPACGEGVKVPLRSDHAVAPAGGFDFDDGEPSAPVTTRRPASPPPLEPPPTRRREADGNDEPRAGQPLGDSSAAAHSLGIGAMVLGVVSLPLSLIPCVGMISLPLSGIGLAVGVVGLAVSAMRGGRGIGFPIAGSAICGLAVLVGIHWVVAARNFSEAMREIDAKEKAKASTPSQQPAPLGAGKADAAKAKAFDWATVTDVATVGDLRVSISSAGIFHSPPTPPNMTLSIKIENLSGAKLIRVESWDDVSLEDEHENSYTFQGSYHSFNLAGPIRVGPKASGGDRFQFERPDPISKKFRLTIGGDSFGLNEDVRLTFPRPDERRKK